MNSLGIDNVARTDQVSQPKSTTQFQTLLAAIARLTPAELEELRATMGNAAPEISRGQMLLAVPKSLASSPVREVLINEVCA